MPQSHSKKSSHAREKKTAKEHVRLFECISAMNGEVHLHLVVCVSVCVCAVIKIYHVCIYVAVMASANISNTVSITLRWMKTLFRI